MKTLIPFLFGFLVLLPASLDAQENTYILEGTLADTTATGTVYLVNSREQQYLDTAEVAAGGRFRMEGKVETPVQVSLLSPDIPLGANAFFLEPGQIRLRQQQQTFLAQGTPLNDGFLEMVAELARFAKAVSLSDDKERMGEIISLKVDTVVRHVLEKHSNDLLGAACLQQFAPAFFTPEQALELIRSTGSVVQADPGVIALRQSLETLLRTAEGQMFSDFSVKSADGKTTVSLSDYVGKGQYVLADFWASWCAPCRREMPHIAAIYNRYKEKGLIVLGIASLDRPADTRRAMKELDITWPQILNAQNLPQEVYGVSAIPHTILFAPDGTILARGLRGEALEEKINEVMNQEIPDNIN